MNRQPSLPIGGQSKLQGPIQAIEIKDLTFTYEGSENGVQHISLVAKRNSPIMLVGESGAREIYNRSYYWRIFNCS